MHTYTLVLAHGLGLEHVVERRHRVQLRRASRASRMRPGRSPRASTSRVGAARPPARAARPSACPGTGPCALRSPRRSVLRDGRRRGVGDRRRVLVEVGGRSQPEVGVPGAHRLSPSGGRVEVSVSYKRCHARVRVRARAGTSVEDCRSRARSSVDAPQYRVQHRRRRDHVRDVAAAGHRRERLQVDERRVAHVHPRGLGAAVRAHVAPELATGRLDRVVHLARAAP